MLTEPVALASTPTRHSRHGVYRWLLALVVLVGLADLRPALADKNELIMGVFPRRNPAEMIEMFAPLANHLSRELGRPVKLETTPNFDSFWEAVVAKRYHIVHYNQYHYIRSHKELGYQVVAMNEEGGKSFIAGAILVRKDSGIRSLRDLRGKTILFGGNKQAMNSYVTPTYLLREAGLKEGDYKEEFALNPPNVALAVFFGRAVAGGIGDIIYDTPFVREKVDISQIEFIAKGPPVPHLPWAVRGDVPTELRARIRRALLDVKNRPDGEKILKAAALTGLVPVEDWEYTYIRKVVASVMKERY